MKNFIVIAMLFALLPGWYACTKDKAVATVSGPCDTTGVTYNQHISRIVSRNCTNASGCHNSQSGLGSGFGVTAQDLTTLAAVQNGDGDTTSSTSIVCWLKVGCGLETMPRGGWARGGSAQAYIDTFLMWKANNYCQGN